MKSPYVHPPAAIMGGEVNLGGDGQPDIGNYRTDLPHTNILQSNKAGNLDISSSQFDVT